MSNYFDVDVMTAGEPLGESMSDADVPATVLTLPDGRDGRSGLRRFMDGLGPPHGWWQSVLESPQHSELLRRADVVEVQWPGMLGIVGRVRGISSAPISYVTHDLRTEALWGLANSGVSARDVVGAVAKLVRIAPQEIRALRVPDTVLCFRPSEQELLRRIRGGRSVHVVPPVFPIVPTPLPPREGYSPGNLRLGFVGDMTRVENTVSLDRFLCDTWPALIESFGPSVELHVVGKMPSEPLVEGHPNVHVHGWVPSLRDAYALFDVAVAPLRVRGGIKFKVAEALAFGLPVVGSGIAFEGYSEAVRRYLYEADDAASWDRGISAAADDLENTGLRWERSSAVRASYDLDRVVSTVAAEYQALIENKRRFR